MSRPDQILVESLQDRYYKTGELILIYVESLEFKFCAKQLKAKINLGCLDKIKFKFYNI